jgi:cytochrome b subunit of formate dehydrogenase
MGEKILYEQGVILRHSAVERLEHWILAVSGFILLFSGFGELPMYKRYMVTQIPGLGWAGDFYINLKIHYLSAILFLSVMVFHAVYHGWLGHRGLLPKKGDFRNSALTILSMFGFGKEPEADKYLPEQRLAYAYLGGVGLILVVTGILKVIKNFPGVFLSPNLMTGITLAHTFGTIFFLFGVLGHLAALVFRANRPLVKPIFTGKVDLEYARKRHPIWVGKLAPVSPGASIYSSTTEGAENTEKMDSQAVSSLENRTEGEKRVSLDEDTGQTPSVH